MNDSMTLPTANPDGKPLQRVFPEGISVTLLLLALVALTTFSVQLAGWDSLVIPVGAIGLAGGVLGVIAAKARIPDSVAHFGAMVIGLGVVFFLLVLEAESLGEGWRDRIRPIGTYFVDWYLGRRSPEDHEDLLISMLMGVIIWLVGYLSAWTLFRRGWFLASLFLPGLLLTLNVGFADTQRPWLLGVFLTLAIPLGARFHVFRRERLWSRQRMQAPSGLAGRVLVIATVLGLLITATSWRTPASWSQESFQPAMERLADGVDETQRRATAWLDDTLGSSPSPDEAGSYTAFDDAFSVGGPLELSDEEEVLVRADLQQAPYLTAHSYDVYNGRGWESGIDDRFRRSAPDGSTYSPELLFRPNQGVVMSADVTGGRVPVSIAVEPLTGDSGVLFSVDTYQSASVPAVVRMSWVQLDDEPFAVSPQTLTSLPPDIQLISSLLLQGNLVGPPREVGSLSTSDDLNARLLDEVGNLQGRLIDVRWRANSEGQVEALYVTGQLPVYDDIEAVFPRAAEDPQVGGAYEVTSLRSTADGQALIAAGTDYPLWVNERYLQLSETVTPRTIDLALEIAGEARSPYEQAVLVEAYLRENIVYDERVGSPPQAADVVDYVLFEDNRGYCEHYSTSMTVMMRALGVPARTVVGYYPGEYDDAREGFLYRQLNAHAWTEVFFPGYGWVPFEPTANRPLSDREQVEQPTVAAEPKPEPTVAPQEAESTVVPVASPTTAEPSFVDAGPPEFTSRDGDGGAPVWLRLALIGVSTIAAVAVGASFAWGWGLRNLDPSASLFARLVRIGRLGGITRASTTTPREYAHDVSRRLPGVAPAARRIVQVYEIDHFGPQRADERLLASAREAWRQVRSAIPGLLLRRRK